MEPTFFPHIKRGIMDDEEEVEDELGTPSASSSANSTGSDESSELTEDATSPASSSSSPPSSTDDQRSRAATPYDTSALMAHLPFKRGLSKHFQGKSQSFTSLTKARCVEDLAKPNRPHKKRLKACRSYGAGLDTHRPHSPSGCSRPISKRPSSRGALPTSLLVKRPGGFLAGGSRPPIPVRPHRSTGLSAQTLLFA